MTRHGKRLWRGLLWLYPWWWRKRYQGEFMAVLEATPVTFRNILDILGASVITRLHGPQQRMAGSDWTSLAATVWTWAVLFTSLAAPVNMSCRSALHGPTVCHHLAPISVLPWPLMLVCAGIVLAAGLIPWWGRHSVSVLGLWSAMIFGAAALSLGVGIPRLMVPVGLFGAIGIGLIIKTRKKEEYP